MLQDLGIAIIPTSDFKAPFEKELRPDETLRWVTQPETKPNVRLYVFLGIILVLLLPFSAYYASTISVKVLVINVIILALAMFKMGYLYKWQSGNTYYACTNQRLLAYDYYWRAPFTESFFLARSGLVKKTAVEFRSMELSKITGIKIYEGLFDRSIHVKQIRFSPWGHMHFTDVKAADADAIVDDIWQAIRDYPHRDPALVAAEDQKKEEFKNRTSLFVILAFPFFAWWAWSSNRSLWMKMWAGLQEYWDKFQ